MRRNAPNVVFYSYNCQLLDEVEQNIVICRGRAVQINYLLRESRYNCLSFTINKAVSVALLCFPRHHYSSSETARANEAGKYSIAPASAN